MAAAYTADNLCTKQGNVGLKSAAYKRERLQIKSGLWWCAYGILYAVLRFILRFIFWDFLEGSIVACCHWLFQSYLYLRHAFRANVRTRTKSVGEYQREYSQIEELPTPPSPYVEQRWSSAATLPAGTPPVYPNIDPSDPTVWNRNMNVAFCCIL